MITMHSLLYLKVQMDSYISDWSYERTSKMQDVCKVGDVIKVKVTKVDDKGKVNVSRKALLPKPVKKEEKTEKNEK
jgi:polyribonucleotide nucleotidyltransferase